MKVGSALSTRRVELLLCWLLIAGSGSLLVAAYFVGVRRGLDSYIAPYEAGQFLHAVCAVATKWLTHIGNYACLRDIQDINQPIHGMMHDLGLKEDGSSWDYLFNHQFVDGALRQLFSHPHWTVPNTTSGPPYIGIQGIGWGMDEGHYNFVNLAFRVFGPSIESLYRTYWLLLCISVLSFVLAQYRSSGALLLLVVVALVQYAIFSSSIWWFTAGGHPSTDPGNPRFLTSLCIVPTLHFIITARSRGPLHRHEILLMGVQAFVLALAMFERITTMWVVVAMLALAGLYWLRRWRSPATTPTQSYYPVLLLVLAVAASTIIDRHWTAHPGIAANGYSSGHNVWFALFYNLQTHPQWSQRYAAKYGSETGDVLTRHACLLYLAEHREEWPRWNPRSENPFQLGISSVGLELMCRKAFFEFLRNDPMFVIEVWTIYNTRSLMHYTLDFLREYVGWATPLAFIVLAGLGLVCGTLRLQPACDDATTYLRLSIFLCLVAALPNWASVIIPESLTDYLDLLAISVGMAAVWIGVVTGIFVGHRVQVRSKRQTGGQKYEMS